MIAWIALVVAAVALLLVAAFVLVAVAVVRRVKPLLAMFGPPPS